MALCSEHHRQLPVYCQAHTFIMLTLASKVRWTQTGFGAKCEKSLNSCDFRPTLFCFFRKLLLTAMIVWDKVYIHNEAKMYICSLFYILYNKIGVCGFKLGKRNALIIISIQPIRERKHCIKAVTKMSGRISTENGRDPRPISLARWMGLAGQAIDRRFKL